METDSMKNTQNENDRIPINNRKMTPGKWQFENAQSGILLMKPHLRNSLLENDRMENAEKEHPGN